MTDPASAALDDALARAVVYRTLSAGFQHPTADRLRQIGAYDRFRVATAALRRLDRPPGRGPLEPALARLASLPAPDVEALGASFRRLFGHTTRGLVCACETEYGPDNGFHQPQQLADISGSYLAFGLRSVAASDVRADHVACECEFMDFLNRKEALLLNAGRRWAHAAETLEVTRQAARAFLRDRLGRFGRAFAIRVATEDGEGHFGVLGRVFLGFIDAECARVGVEAGPLDLTIQPDATDETPMACGSADELIQIQRRP